jgi:hypothetical protein
LQIFFSSKKNSIKKKMIQLVLALSICIGGTFSLAIAQGLEGGNCGTCSVSGTSSENTKECVDCQNSTDDICIVDSGTPKCNGMAD